LTFGNGRHDSATLGLAYVVPGIGFTFAIENYRGLSSTENLTFNVKVTVPGTRQQHSRAFSIVADSQAPLKWRCESP
jgi:hypothetical protein